MNESNSFSPDVKQDAEPATSLAALMDKARALNRINRALIARENGSMAPRQTRANLVAVGFVSVVTAIVMGPATQVREMLGMDGTFATIAVLGVMACLVFARYSKAPITWTIELDEALADYSPLSRRAFIEMQRRLKEVGYLDVDIIRSWAESEQHSLDVARKRRAGASASQFLKKEL
jgi:hypothetical protein